MCTDGLSHSMHRLLVRYTACRKHDGKKLYPLNEEHLEDLHVLIDRALSQGVLDKQKLGLRNSLYTDSLCFQVARELFHTT